MQSECTSVPNCRSFFQCVLKLMETSPGEQVGAQPQNVMPLTSKGRRFKNLLYERSQQKSTPYIHKHIWKFEMHFHFVPIEQNGHHCAGEPFKPILLCDNCSISICSQCFSWQKSALVLVVAWKRRGDMPLSQPMIFYRFTNADDSAFYSPRSRQIDCCTSCARRLRNYLVKWDMFYACEHITYTL